MEIRIRTENHILTSKVSGRLAKTLLTSVLKKTISVKPKDPKTKVCKLIEDFGFDFGDLKIMLYKDFYLVVE